MATETDTTVLWRRAGEILRSIGALDQARHRLTSDLDEVRDELIAAGATPDAKREVITDYGVVVLEPGAVTRRRGVDTTALDRMFEDLPARVRDLCTVTETVTIDTGELTPDDARILGELEGRAGGRRVVKRSWPTVRELENLLPDDVAGVVIASQERGEPVITLTVDGMKVGA